MTATIDEVIADPQQAIAELQRMLDERTAELAARNSAYSERIQHQAAANDVLKVMSASPADPQPVFNLIVERARDLCGGYGVTVLEYDGTLIHWRAATGVSDDPAVREAYEAMYPTAPTRELPAGRAIIDRQVIHIRDTETEPGLNLAIRYITAKSIVTVPLMRGEAAIGALSLGSRERGGFSGSQIELLQTFAEQAVIAITGAETHRELQQRTGDLQESLEYQTATSDVLKVIGRSTFDLQPVLDTLVETAAHLCGADDVGMSIREGKGFRYRASYAFESEFYAFLRQHTFAPGRDSMVGRVALEGKVVHIADIAADPDYKLTETMTLGKIRTLLGVPLLRDGEVVGTLNLCRHRVEPFTERQIELVRTFADQAVIAMENARLLDELRVRTDEIAGWNRELETRVAAQLDELGRVGRLKRFLAPQLAELIVSQDDEKILESHRREIVVVFCDLRGYTAFTETAEPEEVLNFLREYHGALGPLVSQFEGTLDQFSGDGIMVFFNDPVPIPDPAERAVKMAMAMREAAGELIAAWRQRGCELGFGVGIAQGYATLGQIGFADRLGYTAIGTVCNLAARLCAEAKDGQILLSGRVATAVAAVASLEEMGNMSLKGLSRPVAAFNVPWGARD
jgi:adenylate cyclase